MALAKDNLKAHVSANKTEFEHAEARIDFKFDLLRKDNELLRKDMVAMENRFDAKFEISRKHAESLIDKAKLHLLSWMVALTLGSTVFRNLWQFLSISGISH